MVGNRLQVRHGSRGRSHAEAAMSRHNARRIVIPAANIECNVPDENHDGNALKQQKSCERERKAREFHEIERHYSHGEEKREARVTDDAHFAVED